MNTKYTPIIGFEIHIELNTQSKMFCGCAADFFNQPPNSLTCPVCLGLPGALPIPNKKAIDWTIMVGLALGCTIRKHSKFDRKHYFYPDLPKGYQISQYDEPLCEGGIVQTTAGPVNITRVHLEEDTGKLIHKKIAGREVSLVDFNRSGVPLVEIVTEPDIHSAAQAKEYARNIRDIVRHLGVSDCDMEKGSMRLEANISLAKIPESANTSNPGLKHSPRGEMGKHHSPLDNRYLPNYKVEVKNVNSFRYIEKAIEYELHRQEKIVQTGQTPAQETRGWDEKKGITFSQRSKEAAADYRYFPDPDIPPLTFTDDYIENLRQSLPQLPQQVADNLISTYKIKPTDAKLIAANTAMTAFVLEALEQGVSANLTPKHIVNPVINKQIDITAITPKKFIAQLQAQANAQITDHTQLNHWADQAIASLPQAVTDYQHGKTTAISALIGKVMGLSHGQANAAQVKQLLEKKLSA